MERVSIYRYKNMTKKDGAGVVVCKVLQVEATQQDDGRVIRFIASTGSVDRDNDTLNPSGWELTRFNATHGPFLWAHNRDVALPPIGRARRAFVDGGALKIDIEFLPEDLADHDHVRFANLVYQLYKTGFLHDVSVGFAPIEQEIASDRQGWQPIDFKKQELLELSAVPIGANKDVGPEFMRGKGAISYDAAHKGGTPKANEAAGWDGPREVAKADVDDLKIMAAWVDSENSENKTAYKLPHHKADGDHPVVWRAVAAAMTALLGGRGGVDIPEGDKQGVYNHLAKHYGDFEKEPPEFRKDMTIPETKRGRVLSGMNEAALRSALEALQAVLAQVEEIEEDDGDDADEKITITGG